MKKHSFSKKVLSMVLAVSFLITLLPFEDIFAAWTTPNNIIINDSTGSAEISYFKNLYNTPQDTNMYYVQGQPEDIAYCIDAEANGPGGTAYAINDSAINETFRNGLARIAQYGYPTNSWGNWGISASEAQYATQAAMHWWENTVFGGTEGWVRSGVQNNGCPTNYAGTLGYADWLLSLAGSSTSPLLYSKITSLPTAWSNAATPTSTFNVGAYDSDYWILTTPAGVTINGSNTFMDYGNASITVNLTDPAAFAASTKHISVQGYSNRTAGQIHYYVAGGGFQNMIVYQQSVSAAGDPSDADLPDATGDLSIHKVTSLQSSGAQVPEAGAIFQVSSVSTGTLVAVLTTDAAGSAEALNLPTGSYNVHQSYAPPGTILAPDQSVSVTGGVVSYGAFVNNSTYFPITKRDAGSGALVAGATITISQSGVPIVSAVTGADGNAWFESLPAGQYSWQESAAPAGYLLDTNTYIFTLNADGSVSGTTAFTDVKSNGYIEVYKTTDRLGLTALETGAVFQIYLTSSGSYAAAPAAVRDQITTDANGHAISKLLPYGNYTMRQVTAPAGTILNPTVWTFDVGTNGAGTMVATDTDTVNVSNTSTVGRLEIVKTTNRGYSAPEAGAIFQVYNSSYASYAAAPATEKDMLTTDATGYDISNWLPYGTYTVHQTFAPAGTKAMADFSVTLGTTNNETIHRDLVNQTYWGDIQIIKYKSAPSDTSGILTPEPGATFRIFPSEYVTYAAAIAALSPAQEQALTDEITSGIAGVATTNHQLPYGTYTVEQIDTAANLLTFKVDAWTVTIGAVDNQTYTYIRNNEIYEQYLSVVKRDAETGQVIKMAGVTFEILAADQTTVLSDSNGVSSFVTDANGRIDIKDLALQVGDYYIRETKAPMGYTLNTDLKAFSVSIADHGSSIVTIDYGVDVREVPFIDTAQTCRITVEKQGDVLTSATLIDAINSDTGARYSDEDGTVLSIYDFGYSLTGKAGAVFEVFVGAADIGDQDGIVKMFDKDGDGVKETSLTAGTSLDTITTAAVLQKDGTTKYIASLDGLPLDAVTGTAQYVVKEVTAPTGDLINPNALTFDFTFADQTIAQIDQEQSITDARQKVQLTVDKQKEAGVWNEATHSFDWPLVPAQNILFGLYTATDILAPDGTVLVPADTLVDVLNTNSDGLGTTSQDLPFGSYVASELRVTADVSYDGKTTYPLTAVPTSDQTIPTAAFQLNEGAPINNIEIAGVINIYKTAKDTTLPLSDCTFEIYSSTGVLVDTITTDADGYAATKALPYGTYTVIETESYRGYALAGKQTISIELQPEDYLGYSNVTLRIADEKQARVDVYKLTGDGSKPMAGVVFGIFNEADDVQVGTMTTDAAGQASIWLNLGTYYMRELHTNDGYALYGSKISFHADWAEIYRYDLSNFKTSVMLAKKDASSLIGLADAEFTIYDKDGTVVSTTKTGKDGTTTITGLLTGTYTFKETKSPEGYSMNLTVFTFVIDKYGAVTGDTVITDLPLQLTVTKTSTTSDVGLEGTVFTVTDTATGKLIELVYSNAMNAYVPTSAMKVLGASVFSPTVNTFTTNKDGEAKMLFLPAGTYTITETMAPAGYNLDSIPMNVTVLQSSFGVNGAEITIKNSKIAPPAAKTGEENTWIQPVGISLLALALVTGGSLFFKNLRKRKTEEADTKE